MKLKALFLLIILVGCKGNRDTPMYSQKEIENFVWMAHEAGITDEYLYRNGIRPKRSSQEYVDYLFKAPK